MRMTLLSEIISALESGARPKAGVTDLREVPSLGGEQIAADGTIREHKLRFITKDTFQNLKSGRVEVDDILIVKDGATTGKTAFFNGLDGFHDVAINEHVFRLQVDEAQASPRFTYWYLRSDRGQAEIAKDFRGATVGGISRGFTSKVQIPLPPLAEQKRIAGILDAADALRKQRREALAQLDTLLQSTFLDMFGDPVTNPMGWEIVELASLIQDGDKINYGVVQPGDDCPEGKPLIRVGDFVDGTLVLEGLKHIDPSIEEKYKRSRLNGRELLISCVGSIGVVSKVPLCANGFNIARAVARVPLGDEIDREFMLFCLRSSGVQRYFQKETRTVSQPTLNIGLIKNAPIIQPPLDLQQRFARIVESIEQQRARMRTHLEELDTLFASLQSRAFNGEL